METSPEKKSSFDLIDSFLEGKTIEKTGGDYFTNADGTVSEEKTRLVVSSDYMSYLLSEESANVSAPPPMQHQDRINRFLSADEKKPFRFDLKDRPDTDDAESPFSTDDAPREDNFLSETLAKIYIKQRKYDKALKIIRELNLLYPEKNRYFADQIRFLEKLIINISKIK
jgi:hypothetical protein